MVHKIMQGKGDLQTDTWFEMVENNVRAMRAGADPIYIQVKHGRLEIRRQFFSIRVIDSWKKNTSQSENCKKMRDLSANIQTVESRPVATRLKECTRTVL